MPSVELTDEELRAVVEALDEWEGEGFTVPGMRSGRFELVVTARDKLEEAWANVG